MQSGVSPEEEREGIVARLHEAGRCLYEAFVGKLNGEKVLSKSLHRRLQGNYMHYVIWAGDYGVGDGHLDVVLAGSERLRRYTINLLSSICITLQEGEYIHETAIC